MPAQSPPQILRETKSNIFSIISITGAAALTVLSAPSAMVIFRSTTTGLGWSATGSLLNPATIGEHFGFKHIVPRYSFNRSARFFG